MPKSLVAEATVEKGEGMKDVDFEVLKHRAAIKGGKVVFDKSEGLGQGWFTYTGSLMKGFYGSEEAAWNGLFESLCLVCPGKLIFTSYEYFKYELPDSDNNGTVQNVRDRLEIRQISDHYQVFLIKRLYKGDHREKDIDQSRLKDNELRPLQFPSLSEAAATAENFMLGFQECESDEQAKLQGFSQSEM